MSIGDVVAAGVVIVNQFSGMGIVRIHHQYVCNVKLLSLEENNIAGSVEHHAHATSFEPPSLVPRYSPVFFAYVRNLEIFAEDLLPAVFRLAVRESNASLFLD
jgi:hypothetical protein